MNSSFTYYMIFNGLRDMKIWLKRRIYSLALICSLVISLITLQSCPDCTNPVTVLENDYDIIFSGKSLNSNTPGIFTIKENGSNLVEIIENGEFYAISDVGSFVFLSKKVTGEINITLYDPNPGKQKFTDVTPGAALFPDIKFPVISPDGKWMAFFSGDSIVATKSLTNLQKLTASATWEVCPGTQPVFSRDGNSLAFYSGDSLSAPLFIYIVNTDNPSVETNRMNLTFGIPGLKGDAILNWKHSNYITYSIAGGDGKYKICVWNLSEGKVIEKEVGFGGAFNPSLSLPEPNNIVFSDLFGNLRYTPNDTSTTLSPQLTLDFNENEYALYPEWYKNGEKLLYVKYFRNFDDIYTGKLEMFTNVFNDSEREKFEVCNNVYRAFWRK